MATAVQMDEMSVDNFVLGPNTQDKNVLAKSVTMHAAVLCITLSGYRDIYEYKHCYWRFLLAMQY